MRVVKDDDNIVIVDKRAIKKKIILDGNLVTPDEWEIIDGTLSNVTATVLGEEDEPTTLKGTYKFNMFLKGIPYSSFDTYSTQEFTGEIPQLNIGIGTTVFTGKEQDTELETIIPNKFEEITLIDNINYEGDDYSTFTWSGSAINVNVQGETVAFNTSPSTIKKPYNTLSFANNTSLVSLDLNGCKLTKVTNLSGAFSQCTNLETLNLNGIDTSKFSSIEGLFNGCTKLNKIMVGGCSLETKNALLSEAKKVNANFLISDDGTYIYPKPVVTVTVKGGGYGGYYGTDLYIYFKTNIAVDSTTKLTLNGSSYKISTSESYVIMDYNTWLNNYSHSASKIKNAITFNNTDKYIFNVVTTGTWPTNIPPDRTKVKCEYTVGKNVTTPSVKFTNNDIYSHEVKGVFKCFKKSDDTFASWNEVGPTTLNPGRSTTFTISLSYDRYASSFSNETK